MKIKIIIICLFCMFIKGCATTGNVNRINKRLTKEEAIENFNLYIEAYTWLLNNGWFYGYPFYIGDDKGLVEMQVKLIMTPDEEWNKKIKELMNDWEFIHQNNTGMIFYTYKKRLIKKGFVINEMANEKRQNQF